MDVDTLRSTPGPEWLVCQAARGDYFDGSVADTPSDILMEGVNYTDEQQDTVDDIYDNAGESAYKQYALLERLMRSGHWGPFEHPQITFYVEDVSRVTMAQITRHRHASFDVQSQRYVDFSTKDDPIETPKSLTDPDHFARETGPVDVPDDLRQDLREKFEDETTTLVEMYEEMIDEGIPKEDARFILPLGTVVNFSLSVNARMFLHIEDMRGKGGGDAQWEIREMTRRLSEEFAEWMPMTADLYEKHGPHKLAP